MFEVDKSADTNTVNAYVTGFGRSKRIVLWDTTIAKLAPGELLFVMGHEMGHYVLGHVVKSIFFVAFLILVTLYAVVPPQGGLIARVFEPVSLHRACDVASLPDRAAFVGRALVRRHARSPRAYSRWQEHEADRFGLEITREQPRRGRGVRDASARELCGVPRRDLSASSGARDHPLLGERIDFCNTYRP